MLTLPLVAACGGTLFVMGWFGAMLFSSSFLRMLICLELMLLGVNICIALIAVLSSTTAAFQVWLLFILAIAGMQFVFGLALVYLLMRSGVHHFKEMSLLRK